MELLSDGSKLLTPILQWKSYKHNLGLEHPSQLLFEGNINVNRFVVSANYMVDGRVQQRTYIVAADSIIEAIRSAKTDDLLQVTSVALDGAPTRVDPFGLPDENGE